jgi:hypothetical protein
VLSHPKGHFFLATFDFILVQNKKWAANELNMRKNAQKMRNRQKNKQLIVSYLCAQPISPPKKCAKKNTLADLPAADRFENT